MRASQKQANHFTASEYLEDDEIDPMDVPGPDGRYMRVGSAGGASLASLNNEDFPSAKICIPPDDVKETGRKTVGRPSYTEQDRRWQYALDNPDKDTEIPPGFIEHPRRPWTKDDEEQLFDIIESGERNFVKLGHQIQRTEKDCREKYRYLACLEVETPRLGAWSAEQDAMLVRFVEEYKITDWDRIAFHCGTTPEEARQYWESGKLNTFGPSDKRGCSSALSNITYTSATTDAMVAALGDILDQSGREESSSKSPAVNASPPNDSPKDAGSSSHKSPVSEAQHLDANAADATWSSKAQKNIAASVDPGSSSKGRKRTRAEYEEAYEGDFVAEQP